MKIVMKCKIAACIPSPPPMMRGNCRCQVFVKETRLQFTFIRHQQTTTHKILMWFNILIAFCEVLNLLYICILSIFFETNTRKHASHDRIRYSSVEFSV